MSGLSDLAPHWAWLIVAVAFAIAELLAPGFFMIWIAGAALLTGLATLAIGLAWPAQAVLFAVAAIGAVYGARRWIVAHPGAAGDPLLNDRAARLIGEVVTVVAPIGPAGGRVRVGHGVWSARGAAAPLGAEVRIIGVDGTSLLVEPT